MIIHLRGVGGGPGGRRSGVTGGRVRAGSIGHLKCQWFRCLGTGITTSPTSSSPSSVCLFRFFLSGAGGVVGGPLGLGVRNLLWF